MAATPKEEIKVFDPKLPQLSSEDFELKLREPKILLFDIETSANVGAFWRNPWQTSIIRIIEHTNMISWSAKWLGGKQVTKALPDYKGYRKGSRDDKALVTDLYELWERADVLVAHNGKKFDIPYSKGRFLLNGLKPSKELNQYDTRAGAKAHFGFTSNKLDDIARLLGLGTKIPIHYEVWEGCDAGDDKAWATMKKYNAHDTRLLEQVYLKFRSWDKAHPNLNTISGQENPACPSCQSTDVWGRGWGRYTNTGRRKEYNCNDCGRRFSGKHTKITDYR
jgi:hypothetical protein